jgi:PTH1 family peptidyl-tRNA hydrolase
MGTDIDLIVGLGNPGAEYAATRHNAGFWFVDLLASAHGGASFSKERKLQSEATEIRIAGRRIRLLKPQTYMNLSGQAVGAATGYFKIPHANVLVAYDELDLPLGRTQLKFGGGAAGHNGVRSVIEHIGADFWRLRFGVGHPRDEAQTAGHKPVIDHLLHRTNAADEAAIRASLADAAAILPVMLEQGAERAKNRFHTRKPLAEPGASAEEKR